MIAPPPLPPLPPLPSVASDPLGLLLLLVFAHFIGDFVLQSDRMAREKCPSRGGAVPWGWWLAAHGSTHGMAVALLTGAPLLGLAEALLHALIDRLKCAGRIGLPMDQVLHLACKALWVALLPRL